MDFNLVKRRHVLSALRIIDKKGVPGGRQGKNYQLDFKSNMYPPKYALTLAYQMATDVTISPGQLNGGKHVNQFLQSLGFKIIPRSHEPRILRLVLRDEYNLFNNDRQLSKAFTLLANSIKNDERYDFLITPGGFLHFNWPLSARNIDDMTNKNVLMFFQKKAEEAFSKFWSRLAENTRSTLRTKVTFITVGIDTNKYDKNETVTKCVQLVGMFDTRKQKMVHWTGKSYASMADVKNGLIPFDDLSTHFTRVGKRNICILGCHDLKMLSPRAKAKAGKKRQLLMKAFDLAMRKKKPTLVLQHPHNTDTPLIWNTEWKILEKKYPFVTSYASGIRYYNYGFKRRKFLNNVLEKTYKGNVTDVIL